MMLLVICLDVVVYLTLFIVGLFCLPQPVLSIHITYWCHLRRECFCFAAFFHSLCLKYAASYTFGECKFGGNMWKFMFSFFFQSRRKRARTPTPGNYLGLKNPRDTSELFLKNLYRSDWLWTITCGSRNSFFSLTGESLTVLFHSLH